MLQVPSNKVYRVLTNNGAPNGWFDGTTRYGEDLYCKAISE